MKQLLAKKLEMTQMFDEQGHHIPVTIVEVEPGVVVRLKSAEKDGYQAVQVGYGQARAKAVTKPVAGQFKTMSATPRYIREERDAEVEGLEVGTAIEVSAVFNEGDTVDVTGTSKGKGFQGGVRRWGFAGGPKTHGQSDRHRAIGSIGSGTTPGKVWKGKKMPGHMGNKQITTQGLTIMKIDGNKVYIKGAVPGARASLVMVKKVS